MYAIALRRILTRSHVYLIFQKNSGNLYAIYRNYASFMQVVLTIFLFHPKSTNLLFD